MRNTVKKRPKSEFGKEEIIGETNSKARGDKLSLSKKSEANFWELFTLIFEKLEKIFWEIWIIAKKNIDEICKEDNPETKGSKYIIIFLCAFLDFIQKDLVFLFRNSIK